MRGKAVVARQDDDQRLLCDQPVNQIGRLRLRPHEGDVELAPHQGLSKFRRILAGDGDLHIGQFVAKDAHGLGQPIHFLSGQKAERERRLGGLSGPPRCFPGGLDLGQRQPCMVEKGAAGGGQFDAVHAAAHQLDADLVFEIADLAAEGRLRRVQPFLSRKRQAALLGDRDEIAKVPQLHARPMSLRYGPQAYKVFFAGAREPKLLSKSARLSRSQSEACRTTSMLCQQGSHI